MKISYHSNCARIENVSVIIFLDFTGKHPAVLSILTFGFFTTCTFCSRSDACARLMVHHCRLGGDAAKVPERPNPILSRNVPYGRCGLLTKCPTSNHLYLLHKLMPITEKKWMQERRSMSKSYQRETKSKYRIQTLPKPTFPIGIDVAEAFGCSWQLRSRQNSSSLLEQ